MKVYVAISYEYDDVHMSWAEAEACFSSLSNAIKRCKEMSCYTSYGKGDFIKEEIDYGDNLCLDCHKRNYLMDKYEECIYIKELTLED